MKKNLAIIALSVLLVVVLGEPVVSRLGLAELVGCEMAVITASGVAGASGTAENVQQAVEKKQLAEKVSISGLSVQREDASHIRIRWEDNLDSLVTRYMVQRYDNCENDQHIWITVGEVGVKSHTSGKFHEYLDTLDSTEPQQYVYRVVPKVRDSNTYDVAEEQEVLCSNWKICIDPGHYEGKNEVPGDDSYGYVEGDFTLQIATELKERLEKDYGIEVSMTRDSGNILIGGYTDDSLDSSHISLRGEYAAEQGCSLFVSIHTNANGDNANGTGTFQQPIAIDKPIVIANDRMLSSGVLREVCNQVGQNLAEVSYGLGISSHRDFIPM